MADSSWDWWFGDGPAKKRLSKHTIRRWLRSVRLRRWLLSLSIAGAVSVMNAGYVVANPPTGKVVVAPVSFGWATPSPLALLVEDDVQTDSEAAENAANQAKKVATDSADEDEKRRQRLRELLRDDDTSTKRDPQSSTGKKDNQEYSGEADDDGGEDLFAEPFIEERLPEVAGGRFVLPPLRAVSIDQKPIGNGRVPDALNAGEELTLVPLPEDAYARSGLSGSAAWPSLVRPWAAPNTYSHPLYFEDRMLERHGHERWGCLQPIASGARFFATVPMLPYLTTIQEPCETVYSKGYYRAGSPTPRFYQRPPLERRAVIVQSAATAAGFIALP